MRILVACSIFSFTSGEEIQWFQIITGALKNKKHEVDAFLLPVVDNPLLIPEQILSTRLLNIENSCDLLIAIGYPAFALVHPRKRVLLFSLVSSLHECFDTEYGILATPQYQRIRSGVIQAEKNCLSEAEKIICASKILATKLHGDYQVDPISMLLGDGSDQSPIRNSELEGEPWIACESTLEPADRIDLLLDAVSLSSKHWNLKIFVPSASKVYRNATLERIERLGISDRVTLVDNGLSTETLTHALALVSLPYSSMRIPTVVFRANRTSTPVITLRDCGALLELISDKDNGLIVAPKSGILAQVLDRIFSDPFRNRKTLSKLSNVLELQTSVDKLIKVLVA